MFKVVLYIVLPLLFLTGCQENIDKNNKVSSELQSIVVEKNDNCNNDLELYYKDSNNINYYTMCLSKITLVYNDKEIELKEAIKQDSNVFDDIISKLKLKDVLYDGGTKIYKNYLSSDFIKSSDDGFSLIKCNAMNSEYLEDGTMNINYNNDYYFGDYNFEFEEGYCSNN